MRRVSRNAVERRKKRRRKSTDGEEGTGGTYSSPYNRRLKRRARARGFRRSLCLCVSVVREGTPENARRVEKVDEKRGRERKRKVVVCADDGDDVASIGASASTGDSGGSEGSGGCERTNRRAGRLDDARGSRQRELRWWKGDERREGQEGTKGKRVQAGLGSDEGECVTVCIVGALQRQGRLAFYLPGFALPLPSL